MLLGRSLGSVGISDTGLSPSLEPLSNGFSYPSRSHVGSRNPGGQVRRFGLFPFRSPLLRESLLFSFPPANEMFHFTGLATKPYGFRLRQRGIAPAGLSHSEISGSKRICRSPKLIAAYHVLHRLLMPRHPSCALYSLTKIFRHPDSRPAPSNGQLMSNSDSSRITVKSITTLLL